MQAAIELQHLKRQEIDAAAWDACIAKSPHGLIYARSFFLDQMADNWDGLVLNNYEAVMPLPWRKKWGISYVYQIPFVQRLGIYGQHLSEELIAAFYKEAMNHFRFINYKVEQAVLADTKVVETCSNFILNVSKPFAQIQSNFSSECLKNIRKAEKRGCRLIEGIPSKKVTELFKGEYGHYYPEYNDFVYQHLEDLITTYSQTGFCKTYAVIDAEDKTVFAAAIFFDEKRIYYCVAAPTEKGRQMRAPYFFINEILKQFVEQDLLFDFEGSDIPNVAAFYSKFGPAKETYYDILINKLPAPIRWLKNK